MMIYQNILKKGDLETRNNRRFFPVRVLRQAHGRCGDCSHGFTLAELLTVMAVIVALAFLLYPATVKAIKHGEKVQCVSNLKQLSYGVMMYLQDYGAYPESVRYAVSGEEGSLVDSLAGYVGDSSEVFICPSSEEEFKNSELSYVYNQEINPNSINDWLLVCGRLPESENPHPGDMANILWIDGHVKAEVVQISDER